MPRWPGAEALGARRADVGQSDESSWVVLADPEGNEFCILRALTAEESADVDLAQLSGRPKPSSIWNSP